MFADVGRQRPSRTMDWPEDKNLPQTLARMEDLQPFLECGRSTERKDLLTLPWALSF